MMCPSLPEPLQSNVAKLQVFLKTECGAHLGNPKDPKGVDEIVQGLYHTYRCSSDTKTSVATKAVHISFVVLKVVAVLALIVPRGAAVYRWARNKNGRITPTEDALIKKVNGVDAKVMNVTEVVLILLMGTIVAYRFDTCRPIVKWIHEKVQGWSGVTTESQIDTWMGPVGITFSESLFVNLLAWYAIWNVLRGPLGLAGDDPHDECANKGCEETDHARLAAFRNVRGERAGSAA